MARKGTETIVALARQRIARIREQIQAVADRCIVMDKGTIVAQLATSDIRDPAVAKRYLAI